MTWVKLDDQFPDHPKVVAAGGDAAWLYVAGLCYCQAKLTDGRVPVGVVPRLTDRRSPLKLADKLVAVGLWERDESDYLVHDYRDYNDTAKDVKSKREAARVRITEWRKKRAGNAVTGGACNADVTGYVRDPNDVRTPVVTLTHSATATATATANQLKEQTQLRARVQDLSGYLDGHQFFALIMDTMQFAHAACEAYPELDLVAEAKKAALWLETNSTENGAGKFLNGWFRTADKDRVTGRGGSVRVARGGVLTAGEKTAEASRELMRRAEERERKMAAGGES